MVFTGGFLLTGVVLETVVTAFCRATCGVCPVADADTTVTGLSAVLTAATAITGAADFPDLDCEYSSNFLPITPAAGFTTCAVNLDAAGDIVLETDFKLVGIEKPPLYDLLRARDLVRARFAMWLLFYMVKQISVIDNNFGTFISTLCHLDFVPFTDFTFNNITNMEIIDFESITFHVANAKTAANYFVTKYGFDNVAEKSLETGCRTFAVRLVKCGDIRFAFMSDVRTQGVDDDLNEHHEHVSDIAMRVKGLTDDGSENIKVIDHVYASGSVSHTLIDADHVFDYTKEGWSTLEADPINGILPATGLRRIDHVVSNHAEGRLEEVCDMYEKVYGMHRFWSVDDSQIHTEFSALKSVVMASPNEMVKLPINEPAVGKKKSQIQEFIDYNHGPGVQHIAFKTDNIIDSVRALKARGLRFYNVPASYYVNLRQRLAANPSVHVKEDLDILQNLNILVDFDENGYLLQIFTESFDYRPTLFFEIIQRNGCEGFGIANFKNLFECIELLQKKRGNL